MGPLPLSWFSRASMIHEGKGILATALAIWFEAGRRRRRDRLKLTGAMVNRLGITPSSKCRALADLEAAGLIRVERHGRKNPLVTILEVAE